VLEAFLSLFYRGRAAVYLAGLATLVAGAFLASSLSVNDSPERWLPASSNADWKRFSEHFGYGDTIAVGIEFHRAVRDDDLAFLKAVREDFVAVPEVGRVIDASFVAERIENVPLTRFIALPKSGEDDTFALYRGSLFDDAGAWRDVTEADQLERRSFVTFVELKSIAEQSDEHAKSDDTGNADVGSDTTPGLDNDATNDQRRLAVAGVYAALDNHRRDDVSFHLLGGTIVQYELEKIARKIAATFLPLSLVLTMVALGIGFRSMRAVTIAVLGGVWSVAIMLGGVALAGWTLNVVTVGGPTLMAVIIVATTIHIAHHYSTSGDDHSAAAQLEMAETPEQHFIKWVAVPCLGAAMTTGVGFLMLAFNDLGPIREFGIELCAGAVLAFFGAFLLWLVLHPFRTAPGRILATERLRQVERRIVQSPRLTVLMLLVLIGTLGWTARRVRVDADPFSFFQPDAPIARAFDHFSERKFGLYNLEAVLVPKNRPDDPAKLRKSQVADRKVANQFEQSLRDRPEVRNTISAVSLNTRQRQLQFNLTGLARLAAFNDTFRNWTEDRKDEGAIRVSFLVYDPGTGFLPLVEAMRERLPHDRFDCIMTGAAGDIATLSEGLIGGISRGLGAALAVMALLCLVLFRSVKLTLIAFLPNVFPVLLIFGVMGVAGVPLNSGSAMVATIALGVALNDTVHFLMHYQRRRTEGADTEQSVADTFAEIGRPIVLTSVVNCVGFGIFLLSDFRPLSHFGLLAGIAMLAALVGDLILLPNLLRVFDRSSAAEVAVPRVPSQEVAA